jgi:hypothetical protein
MSHNSHHIEFDEDDHSDCGLVIDDRVVGGSDRSQPDGATVEGVWEALESFEHTIDRDASSEQAEVSDSA